MKTHQIFKKVGVILAEISEQYQYLAETPENLNDLELELLSANADFLAEHIKVLKKLNLADVKSATSGEATREGVSQSQEYKQSVNVNEVENADHLIKQEFPESYTSFHKAVENEPAATENDTEEVMETEIDDPKIKQEFLEGYSIFNRSAENEMPESSAATPDFLRESHLSSSDEEQDFSALPVPEEVVEPIKAPTFNAFFAPEANSLNANKEQINDTPQVINEVEPDSEPVPAIEAPKPVTDEPAKIPTINDLMSAQRSQDTGSRFNKPQAVLDLKSIISLNDKLLFIKDLFSGYSLAYSEAIEIISRFDSFAAADNFLKVNYSDKNNWASKQATADKFYELLNRRFAK